MKIRHAGLLAFILFTLGSTNFAQNDQIRARVDLVVVPVAVRDSSGALVTGLTAEDFLVFEDGRPQSISNFSVDPQPLSAAIVIDTEMDGLALRRLAPLFGAVVGGFSPFDEMASFRYDHIVRQITDFTSDATVIEKSFGAVRKLAETRPVNGRIAGGGPFGSSARPGVPPIPNTQPQSSRVLHDAIYEAAKALENRPNNRRKMIIVVSDGAASPHPMHSKAEVTNLLLRNNIQLYAVSPRLALYEKFSILSSYVHDTGGDLYSGASTNAMEHSFLTITEQARNQYVLGYVSNNELTGTSPLFRRIEVRSARKPHVKVTYREGYWQYP